jgi:hypothetical protein
MPFIHVRTLPLETSMEAGPVLEALTREFSDKTGVGLEHVGATWTFFRAGHYAVAGHAAAKQPQDSHPMLVDLLVPDFHSPEKIATMLAAVASSLSAHTGRRIA